MNFEGEKIELTEADRAQIHMRINELEAQMMDVMKSFGALNREWKLAITKIEEAAMWMRKAVERM